MIYLQLFLTFLEIGAVAFGGGYGMISVIRDQVLANGWLSNEELLDMIAVSESTPGPIAVNMATFIGSKQGGIFGAFCATLGVTLPAFIIMLLVAVLVRGLIKRGGVQAALSGIRPCVVGLIIATAGIMLINCLFGIKNISEPVFIDPIAFIILVLILPIPYLTKKLMKKKISPIIMILISAVLGMILYSIIEI